MQTLVGIWQAIRWRCGRCMGLLIGLNLSAVPTPEDAERAMRTVLAATSRGVIAPSEALRIARRVRTRLRAIRRLERTQRRLARATVSTRGSQPKSAVLRQSL